MKNRILDMEIITFFYLNIDRLCLLNLNQSLNTNYQHYQKKSSEVLNRWDNSNIVMFKMDKLT